MSKDHTMGYLAKRLMDEGIVTAKTLPGAKLVIWQWIKSGRLQLRQRPYSGWVLVSDEEVEQIIKEFKVGGSGIWHAEL